MNFLDHFLAGVAVKEPGRRSPVFNIQMLACKPSGNHHFSSSEQLSGFIHPVAFFFSPLSLSFFCGFARQFGSGERASERGN